ncbi:NAD(P)/FAD-dependent oxidoreductase [Flagellimonas okinawensis]|uniref:FAD-dependent oxidoreductase n=1 Tax=Flagellimonas okinawensis TaxID=3031324 RepID=A0ABT5XMG8_9FLAO|nr:FAD-dependent oxidoreductase [[Muricauda] okinawensis]MDF0707007.1 FAD-dependent oxidoreductase [[Muricauda] okinawensis]
MQLSYWENKTWFSNVDYTIVGSGIVGINCAISLKEKHPNCNILILEKGSLPQGASTKNAGFACFGSVSEILSDLKHHTEEEVVSLVQKRWDGIQRMRQLLGDKAIGFELHGSHELFPLEKPELYDTCLESITYLNDLLKPIFGQPVFVESDNHFQFRNVREKYITHKLEGQLDTGKMMRSLINKCLSLNIPIINGVTVKDVVESNNGATVLTENFEFNSKRVLVATNGFASRMIDSESVKPARAQVIVTEPIKNLHIKGTFHFDEGYYYFRNIDDRILFGGGRNLDFSTEETTEFGETRIIQDKLETLLQEMILPNQPVKIERRWSGIMGVGNQKSPIIKQVSNSVFCGVRLGGMGVALGSLVGQELADLAD